MRLESAREDTISNLKSGKKFGIEASAKAFQVLSSNLYERKIEAIVRELGCNASDSHVQAGKADVPFKVTLPTALNPKFIVQDFGLGLSQEEVEEVYTTYFKSTKTGTNDLIGGLGLGSKTPFSYTDSFMVTAIKDGIKCAFTCNIGQSGEPEVNKLFEVKTSESNGVTVEVSVDESDIRSFIAAAEKVYQWFDVKPETNKELDFRVDETVVEAINDYGFYFKTNRNLGATGRFRRSSYQRMSAAKVIMGQVAYDLNIDDVMANATTEIKEFVEEMHGLESELYFTMPIGEADVNAGREKLSLDDRTIKNIQAKLEEIRLNLKQTALDKVSKFTSVMDADEQLNAIEQKIVFDTPINGRTLRELKTEYIGVSQDKMSKYPLLSDMDEAFYVSKGYGKPRNERRNSQVYADLKNQNVFTVIVNDCELKGGLIGAIKENYALPSSVYVIFDKKTQVTKELKAELEHLFYGRYKIVMASSFWDGSRAAKKTARKTTAEQIRCTLIRRNRTRTGTVDFSNEDKTRYAIIKGSAKDVIYSTRIQGQSTFISSSEILCLLDELDLDGVVVYNASNEKKVKRNFSKVLATEIEKQYNHSDVEAHIMLQKFRGSNFNSTYGIFDDFVVMSDKINEAANAVTKKTVASIFANVQKWKQRDAESVIDGRYEVFRERKKLLMQRSEILNKCLTGYVEGSMITELKQYIKLIERKGV